MTVYADILILVNFVVDYFLLIIAGKFLHKKPRLVRLLIASTLGGFFSLYIFLPQSNTLLQMVCQFFMCAVLCLTAFGFESTKNFFKNTAVLFCVNFAYSGAMIAIWLVFKPYGMVINNSVIYFNISPLFLVLFSLIGYFVVVLSKKVFKTPFAQNTYCDVTVFFEDKKMKLRGVVDTGNSITDAFGISQIFITDKNIIDSLLGEKKKKDEIYRVVPCVTVAGEQLLEGYRIDRVDIVFNNKTFSFKRAVLAESKTPLEDFDIIANPEDLR